MTQEEYRAGAENVIYLAACMIDGKKPDAERVAGMDLEQLYMISNRHMLTGIVGYALEAAGVYDSAFVQEKVKAVRKIVLFEAERAVVLAELEKAGIWYMPLKGCVLKDYYPQIGMRQMSDYDFLYNKALADDVKAIMEDLGFTTIYYGTGVNDIYIHDIYFKHPVCKFEMHRTMVSPFSGDALFTYYQEIRNKMVRDEDNRFGYHLSPEDFYIYMIAHEYKHYRSGGTGLRSLLDTYVYLKEMGARMDFGYIAGEVEKLRLSCFERQNRELSRRLFSAETLTAEDEQMFMYILESGTYGTMEHRMKNQIARKGRWVYLRDRTFLPYVKMKKLYPVLSVLPILLPLCWLLRLVTVFLFRRDRMIYLLRAIFGK